MSKNINPIKISYYFWISIAVISFVLVVVRTILFGWFVGKDPMLWLLFFMAIYFTWRRNALLK